MTDIGGVNKGASYTSTSINNAYNTLVNNVNKVANNAQTKISQLYDLDVELINSYISAAQSELNNANSIKTEYVNKYKSNSNSSELNTLETKFNQSKAKIEELCDYINASLIESKVVSARSTWYRPCERTFADIKKNVEMFKNIGINLIFVETFYHGCSAFRTDISDIPYHPDLAASYTDTENNIVYNDYLSAFVACCVENGIEVHAWVENFYVGINANTKIVKDHPDWIMYNDDGTFLQRKEGGQYIFIDPANREVQDLLIDFYNDLFEKHPDVKGLNLDYIRYPVSNQSMDTGFGVAAMNDFYSKLGKEFSEAQLADKTKMLNKFLQLFNSDYLYGGQSEANSNYNLWVEYRTQVITDFVYRIKTEVKEPNKIVLSTAVFASLSDSLNNKKQDWQTWFKNGWIEIATPMAYYTSTSAVSSNVQTMISLGGNKCLYYTGIASSYSGLDAIYNKEFIEVSYNAGACGYVIFSGAQIVGHTDVQTVLSSGVNNKWAVLPHADIDVILNAAFNDILDKADRLYISAGTMTQENKSALKNAFDEILKMPYSTNEEIDAIYDSIVDILNNRAEYANGYARERIKENLNYLAEIIETRSLIPIIEDVEELPPEDDNNQNGDDVNNGENNENNPNEDETVNGDENVSDDESVNTDENKGDKNEEDASESYITVKVPLIQYIIWMIIDFFKKLFGLA